MDNNELDIEDMMKKIDAVQNKIKFKAFGKTKLKKKINPKEDIVTEGTDDEGPRKLSMKQVEKLEEAIKKVSAGNKSRCGKVFEMRAIVEERGAGGFGYKGPQEQ